MGFAAKTVRTRARPILCLREERVKLMRLLFNRKTMSREHHGHTAKGEPLPRDLALGPESDLLIDICVRLVHERIDVNGVGLVESLASGHRIL